MKEKQELKLYLYKLGLVAEEVEVYLDVCEHADATPLLIARRTGINRTKVYRVLEQMAKEKLVEMEVGAKTTRVSPAPVEQLGLKLQQKQRRVAELTQDWSGVQEALHQLDMAQTSETKVKYYKGKAGIEQMVWNVLSAKKEIVGYTTRDLSDYVGNKFMGEFVDEFLRRNLSMRDIYGDEYKSNKHTQYSWGERVVSRYVPKKILAIPHQMDIYDETVSFYHWSGDEVFGVEIINPLVAQMQKQLFELAWMKAKKA
ncbi:MAG: helix-turn-helix domain-containing protein [bacterium]